MMSTPKLPHSTFADRSTKERMPTRLNSQFVEERQFSRDQQLACGDFRLPPTQGN